MYQHSLATALLLLTYLLESDELYSLSCTVEQDSPWGNHTLHESGELHYKSEKSNKPTKRTSVRINNICEFYLQKSFTIAVAVIHTWKQWSVANNFAMEHSVGASGDLLSKARAAWRTINREVTSEVAMSANLNWIFWIKNVFREEKTIFIQLLVNSNFYYSAITCIGNGYPFVYNKCVYYN